MSYDRWLGKEARLSNRDILRLAVDLALQTKPKTMNDFIATLEKSGCIVKRGKCISLRTEEQEKFTRLKSLGDNYSEEAIFAVLRGNRSHTPFVKKKYPNLQQRTEFISSMEAKIQSGKGLWYDQAMRVAKLKQVAKTIMFIEENGYASIDEIVSVADNAEKHFSELRDAIKSAESRMTEIQTLKTHILNYVRTNEVWREYRNSGYSKKYLADHEGDIILHKSSKKAFDELGLKKIPTIKSLNEEFGRLLSEKSQRMPNIRKLKKICMTS